MYKLATLIFAVTFVVPNASFAAFQSCTDAYNYGSNSSKLYAGQVFKRLACVGENLGKSEQVLANVAKTQLLETRDSNYEKACYYRGYYSGVLVATAIQYHKCVDVNESCFHCIDKLTIARHAAYIFVAFYKTIADDDFVDSLLVSELFYYPIILVDQDTSVCSEVDYDTCDLMVRTIVFDELDDSVSKEVVDALVYTTCR